MRASNRAFEDEEYQESAGTREELSRIDVGREKLTRRVLARAKEIVAEFGVELVDVQIRRVNDVDEVQVKVFERMISERKRIAEKSRSEGFGKSAEIRGQKERELKSIQSEAYRRAQEIHGKGDAEAAKIYAQAFGKDPEFYQFLRTLDAYPSTLDSSTSVLLGSDSDFYRYLKSAAKR